MINKRELIKKIEFYLGLSILVITSFYLIHNIIKYSGGFFMLAAKSFNYSAILVLIPVIISLLLLHINKKNIFYLILVILSGIVLISTIIVCIVIGYTRKAVNEYIVFTILELISIGLIVLSFFDKILLGDKKYVK